MRPRYLRWMIKSALAYLLLGTAIGVLMFVSYRVPWLQWIQAWRTAHVHLILVGGVVQMIMGVSLWMFPGRLQPPTRPTAAQGWTLYAVFNLGTLLRSLFNPALEGPALFSAALAGVLLQLGGLAFFLALVLGRVRAPLSQD